MFFNLFVKIVVCCVCNHLACVDIYVGGVAIGVCVWVRACVCLCVCVCMYACNYKFFGVRISNQVW